MGKGSVLKKFFGAISFLLLVAFLLTCLCALVVTIKAKKAKTGQVEIFDHILMNVDSDSMEECDQTDVSAYEIKSIPLRSMVVVEMVPKDSDSANALYADLKVGDVLTFQYVYYDKLIITHRITSIEPDPEFGGYIIQLEGDNKNSESGVMTQEIRTADRTSMNYVIGKVVRQNFLFGFFVSVLKEPIGVVLAIIVPCFMFIMIEIIKVVNAIHIVGESNRSNGCELTPEQQLAIVQNHRGDNRGLKLSIVGLGLFMLASNLMMARKIKRMTADPRRGPRNRRW